MALRITTWNVNGIRNPFQYQPWRAQKSFEAMFNILEADIVVFQETKIQRKDLRDDMVLVQGWDCFWSLPRHKKGYSGVVIYTKQSVCAPIRAEEGVTGILCPPNSSKSFSNLPEEQQIGGYPTSDQLASSSIDAVSIDSEGRCVILEFPAFVLFGVYSPANRDESRDEFRLGFLNLLDARMRNLVNMGKRVFLTGDLNISREELDTANAEASMRKNGITAEEYISTPSRRLLNQLLEGGKVLGKRDEGREEPAMWDICRAFHPSRKGMFTCWEQKTNARPGNCGARIDYVLCSLAMKKWVSDSNIQEGLLGSDHCPVYATLNDKVLIDGHDVDLLDVMNPTGIFVHGCRQREYSTKDILPLSGKLIPEFDGRRSIRDMFSRKTSLPQHPVLDVYLADPKLGHLPASFEAPVKVKQLSQSSHTVAANEPTLSDNTSYCPRSSDIKRSVGESIDGRPLKRAKSGSTGNGTPATYSKGQQCLTGFFKPKATSADSRGIASPRTEMQISQPSSDRNIPAQDLQKAENVRGFQTSDIHRPRTSSLVSTCSTPSLRAETASKFISPAETSPSGFSTGTSNSQDIVHDPIESKDSWSKLFTKPAAPKCEGHSEPCISLLTKKSGMNYGRSFWMCARPLGPTGAKEKNTQWRCQTFIWGSDWNSMSARDLTQEENTFGFGS